MKRYNVQFIGRKKGGELHSPIMKFDRAGIPRRVQQKFAGGKLFHRIIMTPRLGDAILSTLKKGSGLKRIPKIKGGSASNARGVTRMTEATKARIEQELKNALK